MANPSRPSSAAEPIWRYERKFEAIQVASSAIEMILRLHPAGFRRAFPDRWVNNLYLDTNALDSFRAHVDGAPRRSKVRIRWYGPAHGPVAKPVLELKSKQGQAGTKRRVPLPPFENAPGFDFDSVRRGALECVRDPDLAATLAQTNPTLFNRYHRRYLISGDGRFRVTIDSELRFEAAGRARGSRPAHFEERDVTVLELKYDVADDDAASTIAERLPFRLGKYSKYVRGITRLAGLGA